MNVKCQNFNMKLENNWLPAKLSTLLTELKRRQRLL
jgi:hypothetical protein